MGDLAVWGFGLWRVLGGLGVLRFWSLWVLGDLGFSALKFRGFRGFDLCHFWTLGFWGLGDLGVWGVQFISSATNNPNDPKNKNIYGNFICKIIIAN